MSAEEPILARLRQWHPSMTEYHLDSAISSGFLCQAHRRYGEGLSTALAGRSAWIRELEAAQRFLDREAAAGHVPAGAKARQLTTEPRLVAGSVLHAWIEGDDSFRIQVAPPDVKARRGKRWEAAKLRAVQQRQDVLTTVSHMEALTAAWGSLMFPASEFDSCPGPWPGSADRPRDTAAKSQIRAILRRWSPRLPEVSHRWEPLEGCPCRLRLDLAAKSPSGAWFAISIKTTETPLTDGRWWPFWRRHYLRAESFYRAGLQDLFGPTSFRHILIVVRLVFPFPWRIIDLEQCAAEMDATWSDDLIPELTAITNSLPFGHGPEEGGILA